MLFAFCPANAHSYGNLDTDHIFYKLFLEHPDWLREFTGLPLPLGCKGSAQTLKQLEIRCDLLLTPRDLCDPHYLVEFQLYHDHSIFNRVEIGKHLIWKNLNNKADCRRKDYHPREVKTVIIFGSATDLPSSSVNYPSIQILFIDELLIKLEKQHPDSPLLAAMAPLKDNLSDLEKSASRHYNVIRKSQNLSIDDRDILHEIFLNLFLQRFKTKSRKEIRAMIAELTPIKETRVGKELLEEGIERGIERGITEGATRLVQKMSEKGKTASEISELTDLPISEIETFLDLKD